MSTATPPASPRGQSFGHRLLINPAFLVPLALVALNAALGGTSATLTLAALVGLTTIRAASRFRFDRWLASAIDQTVRAVSLALFAVVHCVAISPMHFAEHRRWRHARASTPSYAVTSTRAATHAGLAAADGGPLRQRPTWLWSAGLTTFVLIANYLVGDAWDRLAPRSDGPPPTRINVTGRTTPSEDPRSADPAMGGAPWAATYFAELNAIHTSYWPFTLYRNEPYSGRFLNGDAWTRRSWVAPRTSLAERPLLTFYGGSTAFGIGQRDAHTIPSEVARIAAAEGYPVDVTNHGVIGYVSWQEMLLFEHFTEAGERPLRAVFYDGTNDVYAQLQPSPLRGNPIVTEVAQWQALLRTGPERIRADEAPVADNHGGLIDRYAAHSAVHRLVHEIRDAFGGEPAGASSLDAPPVAIEAAQIGEATIAVYERSRSLIEAVGHRNNVEPAFFWQPVPNWDDPTTPYPTTRQLLTKPTADISDCLDDHTDVYLTDFHTNEQGARLVAACMWTHLGPTVRSWYRERGIVRQEPQTNAVDDDLIPALPPVRLGISVDALGPGWESDIPTTPNLLTGCLAARPAASLELAEAFIRNQPDVARFAASRITFESRAARDAAWSALAGNEGRECMRNGAVAALSRSKPPVWANEPIASDAAGGSLRWAATVRVDAFQVDAMLRMVVLPTDDPTALVAVQLIGTDPRVVDAAEAGAITALAP